MSHFAPAILVFEREPRREAELKRSFAIEGVLVRPCRSASDVLDLCRAMPGSIVVIDLETGAGAALRCLEQVLLQRLRASPVVIASAEVGELEWPLRELGAIAVLSESVRGDELAKLCRRVILRT